MGSRIDLQSKLEDILGSRNVYFQPPENLKIKYPAIIYSLNNINLRFADNMPYMKGKNYTIILIHNDPDNEVIDNMLAAFSYISFERNYISENLYHYVFELYF